MNLSIHSIIMEFWTGKER